jgi:hypothetical protein
LSAGLPSSTERLRHFLDRHADAAALDLAVRDQLLLHVGRDVDRDREGETLVAAGARIDLRVDADHLALQVEERAARVAGIDRGVGLDERHIAAVGQRARGRADDALGHGVLEAERRADRGHPFAHAHLGRIAELHHGEPARLDLHHRDVGRLVGAQHLALEFAPVGEAHAHLVRTLDHVRVGEDHAARVDDEARAHALHRALARRVRNSETAQQLRRDAGRGGLGFGRLGRRDVHHRPLVRLGDRGEVGQRLHRRGGRRGVRAGELRGKLRYAGGADASGEQGGDEQTNRSALGLHGTSRL